MRPLKKSFQFPTILNNATVAIEGFAQGTYICNMIRNGDAPSIIAASSKDLGIPLKKFITIIRLKIGTAPGSTKAQIVLINFSLFTTRYVGIIPPLNSIANSKRYIYTFLPRKSILDFDKGYAINTISTTFRIKDKPTRLTEIQKETQNCSSERIFAYASRLKSTGIMDTFLCCIATAELKE